MRSSRWISLGLALSAALTACGGGSKAPAPPTVQSIAVTLGNASLPVGLTTNAMAVATFSDGHTENVTNSAAWTSDSSAASVNASGTVTATAVGSANIAARVGTISGTAALSALAPEVAALGMTPSTGTVIAGGAPLQLTATAVFTDGTSSIVTSQAIWSTTSADCAQVAGGLVSSTLGSGNDCVSTIQATLSGLPATAQITAQSQFLSRVSLPVSVFRPSAIRWAI